MGSAVVAFAAVEDLAAFVHTVLCEKDALDPAQTPLHQALITRGGRPCGLFFQVHGPRLVKIYAVWAGEEHRILFYDSTGLRFAETRLSESPDTQKLAA